jgi:hypothetical protein
MKFSASNYYPSPHIAVPEPVSRAIASGEIVKSHYGD